MYASNLKKPPVKFIGTITSLKKKPTRIKVAPPRKPLYELVYEISKGRIINYFTKASGIALKSASRIVRLGYNYCLPQNKLLTVDELCAHLMNELGEADTNVNHVVKVKMRDGSLIVGDIYGTPSQDYFVLRCWKKEVETLYIMYKEVVQIHFMADSTDFDII